MHSPCRFIERAQENDMTLRRTPHRSTFAVVIGAPPLALLWVTTAAPTRAGEPGTPAGPDVAGCVTGAREPHGQRHDAPSPLARADGSTAARGPEGTDHAATAVAMSGASECPDDGCECVKYDFSVIVDDATYRLAQVTTLHHSLDPSESYLVKKPGENLWADLWNAVAYEIHDLVDIYEYLDAEDLPFIIIDGDFYESTRVYADIVDRSRRVLDTGLIPQWDEIRKRMVLGYGEPLQSQFGRLARLNHSYHFHAASAVEPIARFICGPALRHRDHALGRTQQPHGQFFDDIRAILSCFYKEWNGTTYRDPAEAEYKTGDPGANVEINYNMAASIGIPYMYLYDYSGDAFFLERAVALAQFVRDAIRPRITPYQGRCYCVW
jgi:hypothetical protein